MAAAICTLNDNVWSSDDSTGSSAASQAVLAMDGSHSMLLVAECRGNEAHHNVLMGGEHRADCLDAQGGWHCAHAAWLPEEQGGDLHPACPSLLPLHSPAATQAPILAPLHLHWRHINPAHSR